MFWSGLCLLLVPIVVEVGDVGAASEMTVISAAFVFHSRFQLNQWSVIMGLAMILTITTSISLSMPTATARAVRRSVGVAIYPTSDAAQALRVHRR